MSDPALLAAAAELVGQGEPFALATVIWRRGPSSGREGSRAIIRTDGRVSGWLGGACAGPTVTKEALKALQDGQARVLLLGEAAEFEGRQTNAAVRVPMACESDGAMEVYVEPVIPAPLVVVVGDSPAVGALAAMVEALGWRALVILRDLEDSDLERVDERTFVVVATQGHNDEPVLEKVLSTDARYVGLVASQKRASAVGEYLRSRGVSEEALARLHAPAGADLGHTEHKEIAVAILAEIVQLKAAGGMPPVQVSLPEQATDPVCGMLVDVASTRFRTEHRGRTYYFCAAGCQSTFAADPTAFL